MADPAFLPAELLDGVAEIGKVGDFFGAQIILELILYGSGCPEVFLTVDARGLEDLCEDQLWSRLLLIDTVVLLYLALVFESKPIDAVRIAQFR